jgi:hypothetical protein
MKYLYEALDKPTRLYIKQCPHCGLKYFGKTIVEDIENYSGSGVYWTRHLEKHRVEPVHLWNSDWYYDTKIKKFAGKFSQMNKIVESKQWANLAEENGIQGGNLGTEVHKKAAKSIKKTLNNPEWKETKGKERSKKLSNLQNDPQWKESIGKESHEKRLITISDPIWKETVGREVAKKKFKSLKMTYSNPEWIETVRKERDEKISSTMNSLEWKETTGETARQSQIKTKNNPQWKETIGKASRKKRADTMNNIEWKEAHSVTCEYCGITCTPWNFKRWHGENCKRKEL